MASSNCSKFKRKLILLSARGCVSVIPREGGQSQESPSMVEAFPQSCTNCHKSATFYTYIEYIGE